MGKPRDNLDPLKGSCNSSAITKKSGNSQTRARLRQTPWQVSGRSVMHVLGKAAAQMVLSQQGKGKVPSPCLPGLHHGQFRAAKSHHAVLAMGVGAVCSREERATGT